MSSSISAGTYYSLVPHAPSSTIALPDEILDVLDNEFVASHCSGYHRFFVHWKDRPTTKYTWITDKEFHHLDPDLLESYLHFTSTELSSFQLGSK